MSLAVLLYLGSAAFPIIMEVRVFHAPTPVDWQFGRWLPSGSLPSGIPNHMASDAMAAEFDGEACDLTSEQWLMAFTDMALDSDARPVMICPKCRKPIICWSVYRPGVDRNRENLFTFAGELHNSAHNQGLEAVRKVFGGRGGDRVHMTLTCSERIGPPRSAAYFSHPFPEAVLSSRGWASRLQGLRELGARGAAVGRLLQRSRRSSPEEPEEEDAERWRRAAAEQQLSRICSGGEPQPQREVGRRRSSRSRSRRRH